MARLEGRTLAVAECSNEGAIVGGGDPLTRLANDSVIVVTGMQAARCAVTGQLAQKATA